MRRIRGEPPDGGVRRIRDGLPGPGVRTIRGTAARAGFVSGGLRTLEPAERPRSFYHVSTISFSWFLKMFRKHRSTEKSTLRSDLQAVTKIWTCHPSAGNFSQKQTSWVFNDQPCECADVGHSGTIGRPAKMGCNKKDCRDCCRS